VAKTLSSYLRGWKGYFSFCETPSVLRDLDKWLRHRLRAILWEQWKYGKKRYDKLRELGIGKDLAAQTASSSLGVWHVTNSPSLAIGLPLTYFDSLGNL
jgi:RNA-directed DNA polymerase